MSTNELACSYASLILSDDEVEVTADKISTLVKAAGIADFEPIWATLFAKVDQIPFIEQKLEDAANDVTNDTKALEGKNVKDLLLNVGSGGGAAAAPAVGGAAGGGAAAAEEEKEEEPKEEEKEESDEDMGFGLFD